MDHLDFFKNEFEGYTASFPEYCEYMKREFQIDPSSFLGRIEKHKKNQDGLHLGFIYRGAQVKCTIEILEGVYETRYIHFIKIEIR
ncbi:MAG: hypothetical protein ACRCWQ_08685 [Bacilli bacterium]